MKPQTETVREERETPRVDAAMWSENGLRNGCVVTADFARQLERELADARKALEELLTISPYRGMSDAELSAIKGNASEITLKARRVLGRK